VTATPGASAKDADDEASLQWRAQSSFPFVSYLSTSASWVGLKGVIVAPANGMLPNSVPTT
jgi:hypothetical protein